MKNRTYGSTTVSALFGEGRMENVDSIRSGTSSLILARMRDPSPDPVPPPKLWINWNWKRINLERTQYYCFVFFRKKGIAYSL